MKRTPLQRKTPLKRSSLDSSSEVKRKTPLRQMSKKRQKEQRERRKFVADVLESRPRCQAGALIRGVMRAHPCHVWSVDVHEPLTRARGGSILDPDNAVALCRSCHDWIHTHPAEATYLGLLRSQYD
jgi:hypothetical protein